MLVMFINIKLPVRFRNQMVISCRSEGGMVFCFEADHRGYLIVLYQNGGELP